MARPRSEDKRIAILTAAVNEVAALGLGAPTAKIAKSAGVAEGTLFTYFENKDVLLNALYLQLKDDVHEALMRAYPAKESVKVRSRHVWGKFVDWGVANPSKRKALLQLDVSDRITARSREIGMAGFAEVNAMMQESLASGLLRDHPPAFVGAILTALAETTIGFIALEPDHADRYKNAGFDAFWGAVYKRDD